MFVNSINSTSDDLEIACLKSMQIGANSMLLANSNIKKNMPNAS